MGAFQTTASPSFWCMMSSFSQAWVVSDSLSSSDTDGGSYAIRDSQAPSLSSGTESSPSSTTRHNWEMNYQEAAIYLQVSVSRSGPGRSRRQPHLAHRGRVMCVGFSRDPPVGGCACPEVPSLSTWPSLPHSVFSEAQDRPGLRRDLFLVHLML